MKKTFLFAVAVMMISCSKPLSTGISLENLDTTAVPQNDFYQYACGGWMANNPLADEYARFGTFNQLGLNNLKQVNSLIEEIGTSNHQHGTVEQKISDFYKLCMDTARRNEEDIRPIIPTIETIDAISSKSELSEVLGRAMEFGLFAMYVEADAMNSSMNILYEAQAGYALGERDYYLQNDEQSKMIRQEYLKHIERMLSLYGYIDGDLAAPIILRLETRLARAAMSNEELRDPVATYNKVSVEELQQMVPQIDWSVFFAAMNIKTDSLCVGQVEHLKEVGRMLEEESLSDLKTLFAWQVIDGAADYLGDDMFQANFDFYGRILSGRKEATPLWKRAVQIVNGTLGEAVGQMYVKRYFPEANKQRMVALVNNLKSSFAERINGLEWMSDGTKEKALEKLNAMAVKIGYPDSWRDYSALDVDPSLSYYENIQRAAKFELNYSLSFLNQPVDKSKWYMTPQTVNAYYNPSSNEICFPAGILQAPFFDMEADDAFNYGAIGVVIGHEMTHGFDDMGCQFDKDGNLQNWWTDEDRARFVERTKVMEEYFNGIEILPGVHANGAFTLGENIADHGGLQISYNAFLHTKCAKESAKDGFTPAQRFFLAYANVWASNIREQEMLRLTKSDPHSLACWRVNGALPHIAAWYEAWDVTEDSPLYVAPENRVHIW